MLANNVILLWNRQVRQVKTFKNAFVHKICTWIYKIFIYEFNNLVIQLPTRDMSPALHFYHIFLVLSCIYCFNMIDINILYWNICSFVNKFKSILHLIILLQSDLKIAFTMSHSADLWKLHQNNRWNVSNVIKHNYIHYL